MSVREVLIPYGRTEMTLRVPEENLLGVLLPRAAPAGALADEGEIVRQALARPIGAPRLRDPARGKGKVCIIVSDITRPAPSRVLLPPILEELRAAGVDDGRVSVVFALGCHRPHTTEEMERLVGRDVFARVRCIDHDPSDCGALGETRQGLPVEIFRHVVEADFRVCTGNIDLHYFAGYTGGAKAIMPGVSSRASIAATHKLMMDSRSTAGRLEGNPARAAVDEVGGMVGIDFILNVVQDENKRIRAAVAGHYLEAHRRGCALVDRLYKIRIRSKADIVVASAGGFPKDINLYQAHKALENAKYAVKEGGVVILAAECSEGLGDDVMREWFFAARNPRDVLERAGSEFVLGGHKAVAIAKLVQSVDVVLVSSLDENFTNRVFLRKAETVQEALDRALREKGRDAAVSVMPYGGATLPSVSSES